jgi:hypothetical protein
LLVRIFFVLILFYCAKFFRKAAKVDSCAYVNWLLLTLISIYELFKVLTLQ